MAKEILCGFGIDVDAVAGWLGSYGGEDSPDDISRGLFAGEVGSPRLLKMFGRLGIKTTWFIPGHSIETFPKEMKAVADAGHEIGIHGYSHENPIAMTREQETEILDKCIELVTKLSGKRPTGYVAPWWEFSPVTNELLLERGIKYDHSLMHNDHQPYYVRVGDSWTKIDYARKPSEWMVPLQRGQETDLIEIPASWYLDDLPPMMFIKKSPNSHGFVNPRDIEEMWRDQFDWVYREYDYAVFPMTIHPDVSGRPHVLMMLERLYHHMIGHPGVRFVTMNEMADDFAKRFPTEEVAGDVGCARCAACWAAPAIGPMPPRGPACSRATSMACSDGASGRIASPARSRVLELLRADAQRLAGQLLHAVDGDGQDRDGRQPRPSVGDRPRSCSAGPAIRSIPTSSSGWKMAEPAFTPVNLITGFLGSGKTTLLQRLLADPALADTAVLINEFGEVGLDHHLLERIDDTMVLLQSGCLCCTIRGELSAAIRELHSQARARGGAALPPAGRREHRPGRPVPHPVDGAGRSRCCATISGWATSSPRSMR